MTYSASDIAIYVVMYASQNGNNITNLRLQKILYYIQGYFLKYFDHRAFSADISNWPYGPVVEDIYFEYNRFVANPITLDNFNHGLNLNKKESALINKVIDKCFQLKPFELVNLTHSEDPWIRTQRSQIISEDLISGYFRDHDPLNIQLSR